MESVRVTVSPLSGFILFAVLALSGCGSAAVRTETAAGPHAPANLQADGQVAYLNAGARAVRNSRRENAYKKMHEHCGGEYEIVREEDQTGPLGPQRVIWFRCLEEDG